jgi:TP901 family phage tail tape measure protein
MPIIGSQLVAKVGTDGVEKSKAELASVGKKNDEIQQKINAGLKFAAVAVPAALVVAGIAAVKLTGDYKAGLTSLVTGAGEAEKNLNLVSDGILKMAVDTGTSTKQLTDGMFMIESAGFHGKAGIDVLAAASRGAKVGVADLGVVANGVTTELVDFKNQNLTAAQATNELIATVASGKTHMQDLAAALSTIAPTAAAVGLHVNDMNAALATMTGEGTNAADAATYLRQLLIALEAPGSQAVTTLKSIGLSAAQVSDEMKVSLPATLQMITDALKKKFPEGSAAYVDAIKNIAGGSKQMQGMLELTGTHLDTLKTNFQNITDAVNKGGNAITGWPLVQEDFNFKLDKVKSTVETLAIKFGTMLMPELTKLLDYLQANLMPQLVNFSDWFQKNGIPAIDQFAQQLGPMVGHLVDFAQWLKAGTPPAQALTYAAVGLGIAIAAIKIGNVVGDMANFVGAVPQMVGKMFLVQTAAQGVAGAQGLGAIASEATVAEGAMATAASGMKLSLAGVLGSIGLVALAEVGIAKFIRDNNLIPSAQETGAINTEPFWISHYDKIAAAAQAAADKEKKASADATKGILYNLSEIGQYYKALEAGSLQTYQQFDDAYQKHVLAVLKQTGPTADETRRRLLAINGPYNPVVQPKSIIAAGNTADETRRHLIAINGPYAPKVDSSQTYNAGLAAVAAKIKLEALKGPYKPIVDSTQPYNAGLAAVAAKIKLQALNVTYTPHIDTSSINAATSATQYLALQLGSLGSYQVGVNMPGHASGITNNPVGHMAIVGEHGPEKMYVPQGASIWPHGTSPSGGGGGGSQQPINVSVYLDGAPVAKKLMPHIVQQVRQSVGSVGY